MRSTNGKGLIGWVRDLLPSARRASVQNLGHPMNADPALIAMFAGGQPASSGVTFDEKGALSWTALSAGVRLSAETIGSVSWSVLERLERGRRLRDAHPVHWLLHEEPNPEQTPMEFLELQQAHSLWWGCSYAQIVWSNGGIPLQLWPLNPDRVKEMRDPDDSLWWRISIPGGGYTRLEADEVLVVRGFSTMGLIGERLSQLHKEAVGLGIATEIFASSFFGQGANLAGFLSHPGVLGDVAYERLKKQMEKRYEGLTNTHRVRLLEEGMTWHATGVDPEKAQLILGRKFQIAEASRILRIPPHLLYDLERATFSNIEHQSIEFVRDHVRPWVVRREQRINKQLFGRKERGRLFARANLESLLRGDMKSRFEAYAIAIQNRVMTPNEARELEDLNPGPAVLDEFQVTPNLRAPSEEVAAKPATPPTPTGGSNEDQVN